jgi:hypothetical protein
MNDQIMQLREVMEGTGAFDKLTKILESNDWAKICKDLGI